MEGLIILLLVVVLVAFIVLPIIVLAGLSKTRRQLQLLEGDLTSVRRSLAELPSALDDLTSRIDRLTGMPLERAAAQTETAETGKPYTERATAPQPAAAYAAPPPSRDESVPSGDEDHTFEPSAEQTAPAAGEESRRPDGQPSEQPSAETAEEHPGDQPTEARPESEQPGHEEAPTEEPAVAAAVSASDETTAPAESIPPAPPPKIVENAREALRKIWNWLLVGEEYRPKNMPLEFAVGYTWLLRVGVVLVVVGFGYLLRLVHGALGPAGRVGMTVLAGLGLLAGGMRLERGRYRPVGHGLIGGGLAVLYFSMYAAGPIHDLFPIPAVFALMALITVCAGVLAVALDSQLIAVFGIIGGYATPIMLSTGEPRFIVLYSYLLLLGVGVLGVGHMKQWRLLNYLAFAFTWILFFASMNMYETSVFPVAITFLSALFVLHSFIGYYYSIARRTPATVLEIVHLTANVGLFAAASYGLIEGAHGRPWPAVMAVAVALFYVAQVYLFLRRNYSDRNLLTALIAIAGFFTVWAVPLVSGKETITVFWSLEALLFLWLGLKLGSTALSTIAQIIYVIVLYRVIAFDLPRDFDVLDWSGRPLGEYWAGFGARLVTFGTVIGSLFAAFRIQGARLKQLRSLGVRPASNLPSPPEQWKTTVRGVLFWAGVGMLFVVLYLELTRMFSYYTPLQAPVLTGLWVALALFMLWRYRSHPSRALFWAASVVLVFAAGKLIFADLSVWDLRLGRLAYGPSGIGFLMRLLDYGFVIALLLLFRRAVTRGDTPLRDDRVFRVAAIALVFIYATLEVSTFCRYHLDEFQAGAISIVWALFAIAFLLRGLQRNSRSYRYSGLILFTIVTLKVFFFDLADMDLIYRVLGAIVVGGLLIGGAVAYLRAGGGAAGDTEKETACVE